MSLLLLSIVAFSSSLAGVLVGFALARGSEGTPEPSREDYATEWEYFRAVDEDRWKKAAKSWKTGDRVRPVGVIR